MKNVFNPFLAGAATDPFKNIIFKIFKLFVLKVNLKDIKVKLST